MGEQERKSEVIKETIEATIGNAIDTQAKQQHATSEKERQALLSKNEGRAQAIPSLIRQMKEAEAAEELAIEERPAQEDRTESEDDKRVRMLKQNIDIGRTSGNAEWKQKETNQKKRSNLKKNIPGN